MRHIDVVNGDADGICALHQLRLAHPLASELVTGLKHEIALLERVGAAAGDHVTVLDLSLARNRAALDRLLESGAAVTWFDHHYAGNVPHHPRLDMHLDPTGRRCTSELVDHHLGGRFRAWAVVGAFGDGLGDAAHRLAAPLGLDARQLARLRGLGESLNYNAYGAAEGDVQAAPAAVYRLVSRYAEPFAFIDGEPLVARLDAGRVADMALAAQVTALHASTGARVFVLPDAPWSRRVSGLFANRCVAEDPARAQAVLVPLPGRGFNVSVRSPAGRAPAASDFCRGFPGGGGRATAAGIERLEAGGSAAFVAAFEAAYGVHETRVEASPK